MAYVEESQDFNEDKCVLFHLSPLSNIRSLTILWSTWNLNYSSTLYLKVHFCIQGFPSYPYRKVMRISTIMNNYLFHSSLFKMGKRIQSHHLIVIQPQPMLWP
ncbi:hypothetical protein AAHE18_14G000600 [Arachis hypogaea]